VLIRLLGRTDGFDTSLKNVWSAKIHTESEMYSVETDIKQSVADLVMNSTYQESSKRSCYYLITEKNIYQQTVQYQEMVFETRESRMEVAI